MACQTVHILSLFFSLPTFSIRYDPLADVPTDIEGEQDRVIFIRTIAQIIVRTILE